MANNMLTLGPGELVFKDVQFGQVGISCLEADKFYTETSKKLYNLALNLMINRSTARR